MSKKTASGTSKKKTAKKKTAKKKTSTSKKKSARKKTAKKKTSASRTVSPEERYTMITEAAYFVAEKNGFAGDNVRYWLIAEAEIDALLKK